MRLEDKGAALEPAPAAGRIQTSRDGGGKGRRRPTTVGAGTWQEEEERSRRRKAGTARGMEEAREKVGAGGAGKGRAEAGATEEAIGATKSDSSSAGKRGERRRERAVIAVKNARDAESAAARWPSGRTPRSGRRTPLSVEDEWKEASEVVEVTAEGPDGGARRLARTGRPTCCPRTKDVGAPRTRCGSRSIDTYMGPECSAGLRGE